MVFVFKTSVSTKRHLKTLRPHIDNALANAKCNFDLEDIDNILRIESNEDIVSTIADLLKRYGFACEELE